MSNNSQLPALTGKRGNIVLQSASLPDVMQLINVHQRTRAVKMATEQNTEDTAALLDFGIEAQQSLVPIANKILSQVNVGDTKGTPVMQTLNTLSAAWEGMDPTPILRPPTGLRKLFHNAKRAVQEWARNKEAVLAQLDQVERDMRSNRATMQVDIGELDELQNQTEQLYSQIMTMEAACTLLLVRLQKEYERKKAELQTGDDLGAMDLADLADIIGMIDRRRFDLFASRAQALSTRAQIREIQKLDRELYSQLGTKLVSSLPMMKIQIAQMVKLLNSREVLEFIQNFNAAEAAQSGKLSDMLAQTATQVASESQNAVNQLHRMVSEYERYAQMIDEVNAIHERGQEARAQGASLVNQMSASLEKKVTEYDPTQFMNLPPEAQLLIQQESRR